MDIASLGIEIDSRQVKQATTDLDKLSESSNKAEESTKDLGEEASNLQRLLPVATIAATATAMLAFARNAIDAADGLRDLSMQTGINISTLASYRLIAEQSGTTLEGLTIGLRTLAKTMTTNGAEMAAAGITSNDLEGAFLQLADVVADMPDGLEKVALVQETLGRGAMALIPTLNAGAAGMREMLEEGSKLSPELEELAERSDQFNDALALMRARALGTADVFTNQLLAVLAPMADEFANAEGGAHDLAGMLGGGLAEALRVVAVLGSEVSFTLSTMGKEIGVILAQLAQMAQGNFSVAMELGDEWRGEAANRAAAQQAHIARLMAAGTAVGGGGETGATGGGAAGRRLLGSLAGGRGGAGGGGASSRAASDPGLIGGEDANDMVAYLTGIQSAEAAVAQEEKRQQALLDAETKGRAARWQQATLDAMTQDEQEALRFEQRMTRQQELLAAELITQEEFEANRASMIEQYLLRIGNAEAQAAQKRKQIASMNAKQQTEFVLGQLITLTSGAAKESKTMFEINKAATMANIVMKTYDAAQGSFAWGSQIGGPYFGAAMAAIAIAAGVANLNAVKSQSFGSGGSVASSGVSGAPAIASGQAAPMQSASEVQTGIGREAAARQQVNITLVGDTFDAAYVAEKIIPSINEAVGNGVELRVTAGA